MTSPRPDPRRANRLRTRARVALAVLAVLLIGYPVVFATWYATADHVVARVDMCRQSGRDSDAYGSWTLAGATRVSGRIFIGHSCFATRDVGRPVPARANRLWAVREGVGNSEPAAVAQYLLAFAAAMVVLTVVLRSLSRGRRE